MADLTSVFSSWPGAAGIIAVVAMLVFRAPLTRFFDRATQIRGPHGIGIDAPPVPPEKQVEAQKQQAAIEAKQQAAIEHTPTPQPPEPHPIYSTADEDTRRRLDAITGATTEMKLSWAIRMFSMAAIERGHEMNYRLIFTSQLAALHALNQRGPQPVEKGRELYDAAGEANPEFKKHVTFESWVQFLISTGYVHVDTSNPTPIASLTPLGKLFLHWTIERGLSPTRAI